VHKPDTLTMIYSKPPVFLGHKPRGSKLWTMRIECNKHKPERVNNVYNLPSTALIIRFLNAAAGYPVKDTWIAAINAGNYTTWPELTAKAVRCHFPESDETQKGHMKKQQQNVRSTRIKLEDDNTQPPTKEKIMQDLNIKVHNVNNTLHSNQTGCFPATSSSGNQYIMVIVEVDGNYIDTEPMKNISAGSMVKTYQTLWKRLTETGSIKPTTHILDNAASEELKEAIGNNCTIQLTPPGQSQTQPGRTSNTVIQKSL
jgi:hypothetical protein